jgi:hypothetical protein
MPIVKSSIRSTVISSLISIATTRLAAKTTSVVAGTFITGLMYLPHNQVAKALTGAIVARLWVPTYSQVVKLPKHHPHKAAVRSLHQTPPADIARRLYLHSFQQDYTATFSGKVTCGDSLCRAAETQIHVASKLNPHIVKTVSIQPDGTYEAVLLFKEVPHENLDWWIVADSPESVSKQIQGREILMEDSRVQIEQPVSLL